jgi:hypothetical protein
MANHGPGGVCTLYLGQRGINHFLGKNIRIGQGIDGKTAYLRDPEGIFQEKDGPEGI